MRNILLMAVLLCTATVSLIAQTTDANQANLRPWRFGLQTSGGISSMYKRGANIPMQTGPHLAFLLLAYAERDLLNKQFSLSYELGAGLRGAHLGFGEAGHIASTVTLLSTTYVQGAVLLGRQLDSRKSFAFGPELGYRLHEKSRFPLNGNPIDLGLVAQVRYHVSTSFMFGCRANVSLLSYYAFDYIDLMGIPRGTGIIKYAGCQLFARFRLR